MANLTGSIIDSHGPEHETGLSQDPNSPQSVICNLKPGKFNCHPISVESCSEIRAESTGDDEDSFVCVGYRKSVWKSFLFILMSFASCGLLLLFCYWKPAFRCKLRFKKCSMACADLVLIKPDGIDDCSVVLIEKCFIASQDLPKLTSSARLNSNEHSPYQNGAASGVRNQNEVGSSEDMAHIACDDSAPLLDSTCVNNGPRPANIYDSAKELSAIRRGSATMKDLLDGSIVLTFMLKNVRYVWYPNVQLDLGGHMVSCVCGVVALETFDSLLTLRDVVNTTHRVTHVGQYDNASRAAFDKRDNRLLLFGDNCMDIPIKSYYRLLIEEVFNPFYVFQVVSIVLWCLENYYYYASCIFLISLAGIIMEVREIRRQLLTLKEMSTLSGRVNLVLPFEGGGSNDTPCENTVVGNEAKRTDDHKDALPVRSHNFNLKEVSFDDLVPGDLIEVSTHFSHKMPVDCMLVAGTVIVNESSLTGESVPVNKTPLRASGQNNEGVDFATQAKHLLFAGTDLVRVNKGVEGEVVMAYVLRTGFMTVRGQMIRTMLHPKPMDSQFYKDAFRFVALLSVLAIGGTAYSIYDLLQAGDTVFDAVTTGLDIITILVPPALPSALAIGIHYAIARLKKRGIFCISPQRVNLAGQVDTFCFDKTGTLTEEGLDIYGLLAVKSTFGKSSVDQSKLEAELQQQGELGKHNLAVFQGLAERPGSTFQIDDPISVAMATCHSLVVVEGEVCGDPIEVKMFEAIEWHIPDSSLDQEQGSVDYSNYGLLRVRPCRSHLSSDNAPTFDSGLNQFVQYEVAVLHELPFSSHVQRMSVVAKRVACPCSHTHNMEIFCKGAPEVVASLCVPSSIPADFSERLRFYTNQGFRVLALATRDLGAKLKYHKMLKMERGSLERDLELLGLLVLQNKLKPQSTSAIETLTHNNIRSIMITGDNLETAASVAQECRIVLPSQTLVFVRCTPEFNQSDVINSSTIKRKQLSIQNSSSPTISNTSITYKLTLHNSDNNQILSSTECAKLLEDEHVTFAISGMDYASLRANYAADVIAGFAKVCSVYSRMKPDQKTQVVKSVQELGKVVGMCGDGSNDCSALKAAHVGVSLSQADASVASPFTSRVDNISCVHHVIQEGRCALVTSFALFKFMMLYSMVQYSSIQLLYVIQSNLGDVEQMYEDMLLITVLALVMGRTQPHPHLVPQRPQNRLLSFSVVASVVCCAVVQMAAQLAAFFYVRSMSWYYVWHVDNGKTVQEKGFENTAVFLISNFQYVFSALIFSKGHPYRRAFYTNGAFTAALAGLMALNVLLLLYPPQFILDFFKMVPVYSHHQFILVLIQLTLINLLLLFLVENIILDNRLIERCCKLVITKLSQCCCARRLKRVKLNEDNEFVKMVSQVSEI